MARLDHVNIHTRDPQRMMAFLSAVLGVEEGFRPPFTIKGHWLYLHDVPVIHLTIVDRDGDFPLGMINHVAFGVYDAETARQRTEACGYPLAFDEIPGQGIGQIFVTGPEGVKVEVQFWQQS